MEEFMHQPIHHQQHKKHRYQQKPSILFFIFTLLFLLIGILVIANNTSPQQTEIRAETASPSPSEEVTPTTSPTLTPTPQPVGSVLSLSFSLPGIASNGGNLEPKRPTRPVTILFYDPDVNAADASVKPLYVIQTEATFDSDETSTTYTKFIQPYLDLGEKIPEGNYQVAIKTDQSLTKIIKTADSDISGIVFSLKNKYPIIISARSLVMGDIVPSPQGDNLVTIADYNAFIDCFGEKLTSETCLVKNGADFDDNGVVDGIDYNIMLRSYKTLFESGLPIPTQTDTTVTPTREPTLPLSPSPIKKKQETGSSGAIVGFIIFFILLIVVGIILLNKKFRTALLARIRKEDMLTEQNTNTVTDKEYYVTKKEDAPNKEGVWLTITDEKGPQLGFYQGTDIKDGFAKISGTLKTEDDKHYLAITKLMWEEA
jgi:hypothetical protein